MNNLEFKDFKQIKVQEHYLKYNDHFKAWESLSSDGRRVTTATTKTECFLKTLKLFKGTHNFIHYGEHLTPEEEERDMQNACRMRRHPHEHPQHQRRTSILHPKQGRQRRRPTKWSNQETGKKFLLQVLSWRKVLPKKRKPLPRFHIQGGVC